MRAHCDNCGEQEETQGDFKDCGACHKACYCSKACQRKHWKVHKKECQAKVTCKVSSETLETAAVMLTNNYAKSVALHSGKVVTEQQKKAAIPGLIVLFKSITEKRLEFN